MPIKFGMVSLGCPKNQVDAELMLGRLCNDPQYELTNDVELADVVIINTCGFIESAKREAIETIFEFINLREQGVIKAVIATGCLVERYKDEILKEIPELDGVVGIGKNEEIAQIVNKVMGGKQCAVFGDKLSLCMDGDRILTTPEYSAYLRIADGCSNCCSYCAIPLIRGPFRSRKMEDIFLEADRLAQNGVKELIIIAQDITRYGLDLYGELALPHLLNELCKIDGIEWIRLLYCYPDYITDELLDVMQNNSKICKYMDIPLQHCNADILKAMNRRGSYEQLTALIQKIRAKVPDITLRTTLIAGFPGETDEQFNELCQFIHENKFTHLGCFAFCPEEDTKAFDMDDQIDEQTKQRRCDIIMSEQAEIVQEIISGFIGKTLTVLCEGYDSQLGCYYGRGEKDAPEIDGKVYFNHIAPDRDIIFDPSQATLIEEQNNINIQPGSFVKVLITDCTQYDLIGQIISTEE